MSLQCYNKCCIFLIHMSEILIHMTSEKTENYLPRRQKIDDNEMAFIPLGHRTKSGCRNRKCFPLLTPKRSQSMFSHTVVPQKSENHHVRIMIKFHGSSWLCKDCSLSVWHVGVKQCKFWLRLPS